jgi:hypothetical protein
MSLSLLGLLALLLLLIVVGIVTQSYKEYFTGQLIAAATPPSAVSPVMANLTDAMGQPDRSKELPQINTLGRDADVIKALNDQDQNRKGCPVCKEQCPDMSKYIRRDSIPCWNCSL